MAKIIDLVTNAGQVDVTKGIVEEAVKSCPEMQFFDADIVPGTTISTLARTTLPSVAFRNLGDPVSSSRSSYAERTATLKLLSGRVEISDAEVKKNGLQTKEEMQTDESIATMAAAFQHLAKQIWYGTGSDGKGFDGATQLVDASMVTKVGVGTSDANTSVWFVGNGAKRACGIVFSKNSKIINGEDLTFHDGDIQIKETVVIGDAEKEIVTGVEPGTIGDLTSFAAFLVSNKKQLSRLCNVTTTTGLNDDMLQDCIEAYAEVNDGKRPDAIFMSYAARKMLRKSRTLSLQIKSGVNATVFAPIPTDVDGIPLFATGAIINTEATAA